MTTSMNLNTPYLAMNQVLEAKKMGSVSTRRRKIEERQQQQALDRERFAERKRRIMIYDHMVEHVSEQADGLGYTMGNEMDMDYERFETESSTETLSERSASTPDDALQTKAQFGRQITDEADVFAQLAVDGDRIILPRSPQPTLHSSLATLADFSYDRYSTILDSPLPGIFSPELDTDEIFSPIKKATPIFYQQPSSRPSLISIVNLTPRSRRRTESLQSPLSQVTSHPLGRRTKRQSPSTVHSGFPAAEPTGSEIPSLPDNAFELIANASQESLPLSTKEQPLNKAERKSSMPRLSTALSHARMSSIKTFMKTPTSAALTNSDRSLLSRPSSHISRPATANVAAADVTTFSSSNLISMPRPSTSHRSSTMPTNATMTALPCLPMPPAGEDIDDPPEGKPSMQRKKSYPTLRRRSESFGQAMKGSSKVPTKHDVPVPTTPGMMAPKKAYPFDLPTFPAPPLPTPRPGKGGATPFTPVRTRSSGIGLGLRSVEGMFQR